MKNFDRPATKGLWTEIISTFE